MKTSTNPVLYNGYEKFRGNSTPDWKKVIEAAEAGYEGVELAGNEATACSPVEVKQLVENGGLKIASVFAPLTVNAYPPNAEATAHPRI